MSDNPKTTRKVGQLVVFKNDGPATVIPPLGEAAQLAVVGGVVSYVLTEPGEYVFNLGADEDAEQHTITAL